MTLLLTRVLRRLGLWRAPKPSTPFQAEFQRWIKQYDTLNPGEEVTVRAALGADASMVAILVDDRGASRTALMQSLRAARAQWHPSISVRAARFGPEALRGLTAEFLLPIRAGCILRPHAAASLVSALRDRPDAVLAYADEDRIDRRGVRSDPFFKGAFDIDRLLAQDYACMPLLLRMSAVRARGGLYADLPRASLYDLVLRLTEAGRAVHAPAILAHVLEQMVSPGLEAAMAAAAARAASRLDSMARVEPLKDLQRRVLWPIRDPAPLISLIVPTRDRVDLLSGCVEGLRHQTDYPNLEIVIVDNDSIEEETRTYLESLAGDPRVRILSHPGPFNYSAINNRAAELARGEMIGLINNDLKVMERGWLRELVSQAARPGVGAVGAMLYYGNGSVQHAGCVLGIGGVASHIFKGAGPEESGAHGRLCVAQEVSAVTGACLITPRAVWRAVGGLDENLAVAYNDIDYCLKVGAAGGRVIWTPYARLFHLESATRGEDTTGERRRRLEAEKEKMLAKWGDRLGEDRFYSPNLSLKRVDYWPAFPPRCLPFWKTAPHH